MKIIIKPLTEEIAPDYFDFLDNRAFTDNSPWGGCYCTAWQMTKEEEKTKLLDQMKEGFEYGDENFIQVLRKIVMQQISSKTLQGYLAYVDGISIGWCNANAKSSFPHESANGFRLYAPAEKLEKAVVCFEISPEYRGKGVATALLNRVIADAKAEGYIAVEGFPQVHNERFEWDYTGPVGLYEKVGFIPIKKQDGSIIMRKELK